MINPLKTESLRNQIGQDGNFLLDEEKKFQQDYALPVRHWLNHTIPDKWIGRKIDATEWIAKSPDLTRLEFFKETSKNLCSKKLNHSIFLNLDVK